MDDCIAAVAASVAPYGHRKLRIKSINQLALVLGLLLDEEDALVSREQICCFCNFCVVQQLVYVLGTYYYRSIIIRYICRWGPLAAQ